MTPSSTQFPSPKSFVSLFIFIMCPTSFQGFLSGSDGKESSCNAGNLGSISGSGRFPGEGNGNPPSILAWEIPWTEEPSGLQSMGMQRVRHDWVTNTHHTLFWGDWFAFLGIWVLHQHSEVVLWELLCTQIIIWCICWGERGPLILFLHHLGITTLEPLLLNPIGFKSSWLHLHISLGISWFYLIHIWLALVLTRALTIFCFLICCPGSTYPFFQRASSLNSMTTVTIHSDLEPQKIKSVTVSIFSTSI